MEVVRLSQALKKHLLLLVLFAFLPLVEGLFYNFTHTGHLGFRTEWLIWPLVFGAPFIWLMKKNAKSGRAMAIVFALVGLGWSIWSYQRAARQGDIVLSLEAWLKFVLIALWSYRAWNLWNASYLRAEKKWYEGLPQGIPNLSCQIKSGAKPAKVNRIDRQGLVVFNVPNLAFDGRASELEIELSHQASAKKFVCKAQVMSRQSKPLVLGLKFKDLTSDQKKDLGDFVEKLKGEGYENFT